MVKIAPWEMARDYGADPPVEVAAPRPDFKNALYQFLIGLVQTACPPKDGEAWYDRWEEPPGLEEMEKSFLVYEDCFNLDAPGPAFMQDFDLPESSPVDASLLLISSPGGNTLKQNKDFFIKGKEEFGMTPYWAAVALFTLQINAPSGGRGHRTGMRDGGPLTTLVLPEERKEGSTLWEKVWLNTLTVKDLQGGER